MSCSIWSFLSNNSRETKCSLFSSFSDMVLLFSNIFYCKIILNLIIYTQVNRSKINLVKDGEDILVTGDKESIVTSEAENVDLEVPPVTLEVPPVADVAAEEASHEVEQVPESIPKDPSHDTIKTYDVQNDDENTNESECLEDNKKLMHTPVESVIEKSYVQEEKGALSILPQISTPIRKEEEEEERENDFIPEVQPRDEVSIPEETMCKEVEHIDHEVSKNY